jgi:hypothetical protein
MRGMSAFAASSEKISLFDEDIFHRIPRRDGSGTRK